MKKATWFRVIRTANADQAVARSPGRSCGGATMKRMISIGLAACLLAAPAAGQEQGRKKRDPFRSLLVTTRGKPSQPRPPENRPPGPAGLLISEIRLAGLATGVDKEPIAVVYGNTDMAYFLREGDKVYDGFLKEITKEGAKFVRVIKDDSRANHQEVFLPLYSPARGQSRRR